MLGANEQPAEGNGRRGMTEFVEWKTMQDVEAVAGVKDHQLAGSGDTEEPPIDPDRGPKIVAADPFLITNFSAGCVDARHNATVTPEPGQVSDCNAGGHV